MNTIQTSQFLWKNFNRILSHSVRNRLFGTSSSLIDVKVNSKTGVSTVTMQRLPVNSLSLELVNDLIGIMMEIEKSKGKGMILTSSAHGVFTAGLDIMELYKPNPDRVKAYWTALQDMWLHLYSARYPTVAAITGHSPGGGCLISTSCDYRVMTQGNFTIGLNETQLGLAVPSWFVDSFRNVVPKRVSEMALISGKLFLPEEALEIGLIDEIGTDNNDNIAKAEQYISKLLRFNYNAMAQTKLTLRYDAIKRLQDNKEQDLRVFLKFVNSPEVQRGLEMYLESLKKKST